MGPTEGGETRVFIVEERPNPSTEFFILPLYCDKKYDVRRCYFNQMPALEELKDSIVVLVRYVSKQWRNLLDLQRSTLQALYFFMDDDVLNVSASKGMPWGYRWKLFKQAARHANWLRSVKAQFLVSTTYLAKVYEQDSPQVIDPKPLVVASNSIRAFYHGSITHHAEIDWLYPVIKEVLAENENLYFELIGNAHVNRQFRHLERVQVMNLMPWPAYKQFIRQPGRDIGLVPLLDNAFNAARSCTKYFDVTQAGAVGIYAEHSECGDFARDGIDGIVLPMDRDLWVETILKLAADPVLRTEMSHNAQRRLKSLS